MRDDFAALDLFSAGTKPGRRKGILGLPRRKQAGRTAATQKLAGVLPLLADKMKKKKKAKKEKGLEGWPVKLSWPTKAAQDFPDELDFLN